MPHQLSDDECIALAMLHGARIDDWRITFAHITSDPHMSWAVWHEHERMPIYDGCAGATRGEAARKYCERHKLLQEVRTEDATPAE